MRARTVVPLALAQFVCSFAGSNMNVMINDISTDLGTTVHGVQVTITLFLLVMAALMIPGGKLTDRYGRKRCLLVGLAVYGVGAVVSAIAPGIGVLAFGNSILEGVGTALLIPPVYVLATVLFHDLTSRARAFGAIMAMGGIGAAAGPLIGGLITSVLSWRAAFAFQALVVLLIILLTRRLRDPLPANPDQPFDTRGAALSAAGLTLVIVAILAAGTNWTVAIGLFVAGCAVLLLFFLSLRTAREPLVSLALFRDRVINLGLLTQHVQWLVLMGISFVVAAYLQVVRGHNAVETGLFLTPATIGLLITSLSAQRFARNRSQRSLIIAGFAFTLAGIGLLLCSSAVMGLFLIGIGVGTMLTPSVNIVQSRGGPNKGEISGVSRSVSNLGSATGTAIAGTILATHPGEASYTTALTTLAAACLIGLAAALLLPRTSIST
ncbi:MFS transporter [Actinokineospora inagensis]|uniref:MFS transporter n=1 Tax=Actinokineospora inagensis TaxID=103730 RepID=UPI00047EA113|nr:MFS transporter [Actinokineospora inagensis]